MSKAKQCDRCKSFYGASDTKNMPSIDGQRVFTMSLLSWDLNRIGDFLDLCPKCANELVRWLDTYSCMPAQISYTPRIEEEDER